MKRYYRIMLGKKNVYAEECYKGNFIGADFGINIDLTNKLPDNWKEFNKEFRPIYLQNKPNKSKIAAGLSCGFLHTISKGIKIGDIVLCPNGSGSYYVGEILDNYSYQPNKILPHRRNVNWYPVTIDRSEMSSALRNSSGSIGTVSEISQYAEEIENLLKGSSLPSIVATDETIESPSSFAIENQLEEFLVGHWEQTELGAKYDIYESDGEIIGRQYPTETGKIDILAISKDKKDLVVIELKRGRASDIVVGQIQRYMGDVLSDLAEDNQTVKGIIIAFEDDLKIHRALSVTQNIDFYTYQLNFQLTKM